MALLQPTFKLASQAEEFAQIHRLNYRTFVEEIPQHPPNPEKMLIDRFHDENVYCICLYGQRLVGMLAVRSARPFSLDDKVPDLDRWLPPATCPCEIRLLALEPEYRRTNLFAGLLHFAAKECIHRGYTLAVVSGTLRQIRLYERMGFIPFAAPVGTATARYQPMYLSLHSALSLLERLRLEVPELPASVSFLPGPVEISTSVRDAFCARAISHRAAPFLRMVADTEHLLCRLTGARYAELFLGSGTLANDVVAAQLKVLNGKGLVLSNGEFGERLIDHAGRMGLDFDVLRVPWGSHYDPDKVEQRLQELPQVDWLWSTHCETSSGILNDLKTLTDICRCRGVKLCLDCTSSLGTVPVSLVEVFLASSVSGKGLASLSGIGLVFYNKMVTANNRIPRYLDLGYYRTKQGVPFTQSSHLVAALYQALRELETPRRFESIRHQYDLLRRELSANGIAVMAAAENSAPAVLSIRLPPEWSSRACGDALERRGFLLSYRSEYLLEQNIVQVCLMGKITDAQCHDLVATMAALARTATAEHSSSVSDKQFHRRNRYK